MNLSLTEYLPERIWLKEYPIRYAGTTFNARMAVIRLMDSTLMIHSPSEIDQNTKAVIEKLGEVSFIVAPGSYHYLYVKSAQEAFPNAETFICPGIERKCPELDFDWILGDRPDPRWENDFEQVLVRGNKYIWEVTFFHIPTKTLILVDLLENITDTTPGVNWLLKLWWKAIFHMWNHPKPAPEYQLGWRDKVAARKSLERICKWDSERIIIAHGDLIESGAKEALIAAWKNPLKKT